MKDIIYQVGIPVLAFISVVFFGISILITRGQKKKSPSPGQPHIEEIYKEQSNEPTKTKFLQLMEKIGNYTSHGRTTTTLWEQLVQAGYFNKSAAAIYTGVKLLLFMIGLIIFGIVLIPTEISVVAKMTSVLLGAVVFFFLPNIAVLMQYKKRHDEISHHLPEAIDLLEICVSSGIGLDMAWNIVSDEIKPVSTVLSDSMNMSNFEMHLGADRIEAMQHMAKRTGVEALASLAALLIQTEKFGTNIGTALQAFATAMRDERNSTAEENAEKMAVKLIVPMVLFIFPAVLITVVGPAAINIATVLLAR